MDDQAKDTGQAGRLDGSKDTPPVSVPTPPSGTLPLQPAVPPKVPMPDAGKDALESDIAHILEEVKLPERHAAKMAGDIQKHAPSPATSLPNPDQILSHADDAITQSKKAEKENIVTPLHTLKDDLRSVVRDKKISVVRAVALEEEKRARSGAPPVHEAAHVAQRKRTGRIVATAVILIALGLAALGGVVFIMQSRTGNPQNTALSESLLFAEQTAPIAISNQDPADLKRLVASARQNASLTLGAIIRVVPTVAISDTNTAAVTTRTATLREFFAAIGTHTSEDLARALGSDFFFGFHTVDKNAPVLVIPVTSYEHAFAGMLDWEGSMSADLSPIFTLVPHLTRGPDGLIIERKFGDVVMRNYDVRALKDDSGTIQLYYSFPTRNLLIIAESPYSFTEVLSRLRADRRL